MAEFKKGDVVILKSGGPQMTVESLSSYMNTGGPEEGALCVWFDKDRAPHERVFDTSTLKPFVGIGAVALRRS
jgi:uncharacterized protein YodC (DUF2158 family)